VSLCEQARAVSVSPAVEVSQLGSQPRGKSTGAVLVAGVAEWDPGVRFDVFHSPNYPGLN